MPIQVTVVASDSTTGARLTSMIAGDSFQVTQCTPAALPAEPPGLYVIALPGIDTPEEAVIERIRADETTASTPIVIASALPMVQLQSVPYASDWTIAIVEEPVQPQVLAETIKFLLNPE